jgi:hypothetical protein
MKRINVIILIAILIVSCFFISSCFTAMFMLDCESQDYTSEEYSSPSTIDYSSLYKDLSKEESIYAEKLFSCLVSDEGFRNSSSFDNLGYAITEEDALFYAKASALMGDSTNEFKMLAYLGYEIDENNIAKAENYLNAKNLTIEGMYTKAFHILKDLDYLDSELLANELIMDGLVDFKTGDIGPAGGYIFYDKGYYSDGWRYLEAAPEDLRGRYYFGYYRTSSYGTNNTVGTANGIGSGEVNTSSLVKAMGEIAYTRSSGYETVRIYAAKACAEYTLDGYSDWFLPSKDELNLMYVNLYKKGVGSFVKDGYYLSSSECSSDKAWTQHFYDGIYRYDTQNENAKACYCRVRSIRAF